MQYANKNKEILVKEWNGIYNSKASKFVLVSNVDGYRYRKEGRHYVIGNKNKVEHKHNELQQQAKKNNSVFLPFDNKNFSFSNASSKEILFHINLDEEEIITKENVWIFLYKGRKNHIVIFRQVRRRRKRSDWGSFASCFDKHDSNLSIQLHFGDVPRWIIASNCGSRYRIAFTECVQDFPRDQVYYCDNQELHTILLAEEPQ